MDRREPLAGVTSIRTRLAVLVGASVVVAALVGALGTDVGVPLWISLPVTIALALVVTRWLATGMTTPLREMTAAASRVAAGDYDVRVTDSGTAEIGALSRALSSMAHDLGAADEHRRRLVATVAHELRTPLAAQQALLENLVDGVTAPDDAALQQALHQSERLGALVADLLDLSRDDGRGAPMTPQRLPVRELLDRAVGEAALQSRSVELVARVDPEDLVVTADRGRLQQVLANLVDNALRHSPEAGTVTLRAALAGPDHWSLVVEDEGPGLAPDRAERLFDRFGSGGDAAGGTGLGLAIVGWVAAMHGGRVEALPPREGSSPGARLRMTLPLDPSARLQEPVMSTPDPALPAPTVPTVAPLPDVLDQPRGWVRRWWPERDERPQTRAVGVALAVGVLAAVVLPGHDPGLGLLLVLVAGGVSLWVASPRRSRPLSFVVAALAVPLALTTVLRADFGLVVLALLTAAVLAMLACTGARSLPGVAAGVLAWPAAALRGLPLLDRTLRASARRGQVWSTVRVAAISLVLLLVFGGLLASSDAVLGSWVDAALPEIGDDAVFRVFTFVFFAGVTLCGLYVAINPPAVDAVEPSAAVGYRVPPREWQVPLVVVIAVFVAWLAAQAASLVGGHEYVLRTTGVTYAESAREGFAQLALVTALTIGLVSLVRTWGRAERAADRRLRTGLCTALCVLALLVVGSALRRMALYQEAYGWTVTRVAADLLEIWFGVVLLGVLVSLYVPWRRWSGRFVVLTGAATMLVLTVGDVSAFVAGRNIARYEATGRIDTEHLTSMSADAAPTIHASSLPRDVKACALARWSDPDEGVPAWNLSRHRAQEIARVYVGDPAAATCPSGPRWS